MSHGHGQVVMGPQQPRPQVQDQIPAAPPRGRRREDGTVTVVLSTEDYRFATEYDPERERSANRREVIEALGEIQALLRDNRVQP